jgi:hypothetical protein
MKHISRQTISMPFIFCHPVEVSPDGSNAGMIRIAFNTQVPRRSMAVLFSLFWLSAFLWLNTHAVQAQTSLTASNVYNVVGEYSFSYFRSNIDISPLIGDAGSNTWDFSQPQAANDMVARMDVVPISDSGDATDFPGATFAWRYMGGAIQGTSWEYYSLDPTNGLVFYGTYYPVGFGALPAVPVTPPIPLLPPVVVFGASWNSEYEFAVQDPLLGTVPALYQASMVVDAYGTLKLPGLNPLPALRIAASENYYVQDPFFGTWDLFQQDTNWQWLAPGVGFAAQAVSYAPNEISISAQPYTNSFSREFTDPVNSLLPNVNISLKSGVVNLSWGAPGNVTGYLLEKSASLSDGVWLPAAQTTSSYWQEPSLNAQQEFYRIRPQP